MGGSVVMLLSLAFRGLSLFPRLRVGLGLRDRLLRPALVLEPLLGLAEKRHQALSALVPHRVLPLGPRPRAWHTRRSLEDATRSPAQRRYRRRDSLTY